MDCSEQPGNPLFLFLIFSYDLFGFLLFIRHVIWDKDIKNLGIIMSGMEELLYGFALSQKAGIYPIYIREKRKVYTGFLVDKYG